MKEISAALVRHVLGVAGGWLAARGYQVDGTAEELIAGALATLIAVAWSIYQKRSKSNATSAA